MFTDKTHILGDTNSSQGTCGSKKGCLLTLSSPGLPSESNSVRVVFLLRPDPRELEIQMPALPSLMRLRLMTIKHRCSTWPDVHPALPLATVTHDPQLLVAHLHQPCKRRFVFLFKLIILYLLQTHLQGWIMPVLVILSIRLTSCIASYSFCSSLIPSRGLGPGFSSQPVTGLTWM